MKEFYKNILFVGSLAVGTFINSFIVCGFKIITYKDKYFIGLEHNKTRKYFRLDKQSYYILQNDKCQKINLSTGEKEII
jgi:hypothetical protein